MEKPIQLQARPAAPPPAAPQPASLAAILFAAPHRPMFLAGAVQIVLVFLPWLWELLARSGAVAGPAWPWPPGWVHGLWAAYGVFPFFVFGFLMTAMPRWQGMPDTPGSAARAPWLGLVGGWLAFDLGLLAGAGWLQAAGLALVLGGWLRALAVLRPVAFRAGKPRLHPGSAWLALAAGAVGLAAWIVFALTGAPLAARAGLSIGVYGLLAPLFMVVSHRMIPFFSGSALPRYEVVRPDWTLRVLLGVSATHGLLDIAGMAAWAWPADLLGAGTALWLSWKWQLRRSFEVRLLAMLHIGFAWLGVAWLLAGGQGLLHLAGLDALGLAPLHALAVGYFATMTLAMVSRVTLGHSGRPLVADGLTWRLALGLHGVAALRVLADVLPAGLAPPLLVAAGAGWLIVFLPWTLRLVPIYLTRRSDG
ncbi:NnrS family protein, partial [Zoogloea sp.]|uniref:NnrS family protein n=1 Tax=Zoogloea sp. TaxID=49181 RepID=UPI0035AEBA95